jgi:zinc ribbon protein
VYCPDCGKANPVGQKFCRSCGLSLKPVSQALAGEVVPADASLASRTVVVQGAQRFWQNPLIYALMLILLGIVIGGVGERVFQAKTVSDIGTIIALLGVGLLGFKGVMLVIAPPRSSARSEGVAEEFEDSYEPGAGLLSAEPPSVTENTTRQLDANVEREKEKSRDTKPTL